MATGQFDIGAFIRLDGESQFKSAVADVNNSMKGMKAELARVKEEYAGNMNSLEALTKKNQILSNLQGELTKKIDRLKEGQRNANTVLEEYGQKVETMKTKLREARSRLEEMRDSGESSADAIAQQEAEVERLSRGLNKANENLARQQARVSGWGASLQRAETEQKRLNNQVKENERYLEEARRSVDRHAHSIDENGRVVRQTTEVIVEWGEAIKTAVADKVMNAGIDAFKELGSAAVDTAMGMQKAGNQIEASMNVSGNALEGYKDALAGIYGNNYGDSLEEVGEAISATVQTLGKLGGTELQNVVESAFTLQDTFGMDMQETIRGTQSLMYQFGMTAEEAMDLIGSGARSGLNYTDELGDNLSEYAGKFSQAGYSAKEYFQLLKNGTSNGAYNLDKVNDAINEVTTRLADGTIEDAIGTYSSETQVLFRQWQQGGATQKQVIDAIVSDIARCQNQQEAMNIAAQAFGTMAEDGSLQFISSLTSLGNEFDNVQGKMDEIKETKYDDLNSQITGIARTIEIQLGEQIERMLPLAADGLGLISENLEKLEVGIVGIGTAVAANKFLNSGFANAVLISVRKLTAYMHQYGLAATVAAVKTKILNAIMSVNPAVAFLTALAGVTAAFGFYKLVIEKSAKTTNAAVRESQDAYEELSDRIDENREAREAASGSIETEYAACRSLADELYNMSEEEKNSAEGKAKMSAAVDTLNEKIPGLNLQISETTGQLNMEKSALDAAIESMEKHALASAAQDSLKEIAAERIDLIKQKEEAIATYDKLSADHAAAQTKWAEEAKKENDATKERTDGINANAYAASKALTKEEEYKGATENAANSMMEQQKVIAGLNDKLDENKEEFEETSKIAGKYASAAEGVTTANEEAAESTQGLTQEQIEAAKAVEEAYEKMQESIEGSIENSTNMFNKFSGGTEISKEDVLKNLDSQVDGIKSWSKNMRILAGRAGEGMTKELYDYLAEMGPQSANLVQAFANMTDEELKQAAQDFAQTNEQLPEAVSKQITNASKAWETDGAVMAQKSKEATTKATEAAVEETKNTGSQMAEGVKAGADEVASAAGEVTAKSAEAVQEKYTDFRQAAQNAAKGIADGIAAGRAFAVQEAYATAGEVMKAAQSNSSGFHTVGYNMMTGVVSGMNSGSALVYDKVRSILDTAKKEARKETKSSSPSRVWRDDVGTPIAEGLAKGISDGTGKAQAASRDAAKATLTAAKEELGIHSPSTAFEKQVGKQIVEGTAFGIKINKKKSKKAAKKMAQEVAQAAAEAVENFKAKNVNKINQTLDDETYMWNQLIKKAKKGSKAYRKEIKKIAKENLKEISLQRKAEKFSTQDSLIETYKQYYELSAKAEMDYWELARKQFAEGTDARISADQKYFEAKENYNEQLKTLQDDYYDKCAEINEKLKEDVDEVTEAYESAFSERKEAIRSAFGSFDAFTSESEAPETLLKNMQSQVTGYALWAEQLAELEGKKILKEPFLEELRQMGPEAAATIVALNQMTAEQLTLAQEAWDEKDRLAEAQAAKETEALRVQSENRIKELREQAQKELNAQKQAYESAAAEVSKAIAEPLANLVKNSSKLGSDAVAGMIAGLKGKVADKKTAADLKTVEKKLETGMNGLPAKGKAIGKDTLAGLLKGLTNKLEIKKGAKSFVKELEDAIRKEAGIHSPSTRFRDAVGVQIPAGVAEGMEKGTEKAVQSGAGMVAAMLEGSKEKIRQQQAAIAEQMAGIHAAEGVAAINGVTAHTVQKTSVIVNNSGVAEMLGSITAEMREMRDDMRRFRVVLDTGETVGVFTAAIGNELARQAARW